MRRRDPPFIVRHSILLYYIFLTQVYYYLLYSGMSVNFRINTLQATFDSATNINFFPKPANHHLHHAISIHHGFSVKSFSFSSFVCSFNSFLVSIYVQKIEQQKQYYEEEVSSCCWDCIQSDDELQQASSLYDWSCKEVQNIQAT